MGNAPPLTSISEIPPNQITTVVIYPNPFSETATIEVKGINDLPISFSLYDQLGRQAKHFEVSSSKFKVDREGLSDGIYFYLLEDKDTNKIGRGKLLITSPE